jgi:hypothetical protein
MQRQAETSRHPRNRKLEEYENTVGNKAPRSFQEHRTIRRTIYTGFFSCVVLAMTASLALAQNHTSSAFLGAKVNGGTVTHSTKDGKDVLTLSADFKVPDTPDPHWQVVDSRGNTYLLQRLGAKSLGGLAKDRHS